MSYSGIFNKLKKALLIKLTDKITKIGITMANEFKHWSDITAERIIRDKGEKDVYTVASGITPSGTVHFGNFREVITVDMVARALKRKGKKVRFIFSWDDYDTFRKIPTNMPKQDELEKYMFQPIVDTPDPYGVEDSYARHHEVNFENDLPQVGVDPEFIYQAKMYKGGKYTDQILHTLKETQTIKNILNEHRTSPLPSNWYPVSVYCSGCKTDKTNVDDFNEEKNSIHYTCEKCDTKEELDLSTTTQVKLPWRVDWPMRWKFEDVDFEPGGKDHSSQGGSYTTAKEIINKVYNQSPPVYLQYDFVSIRGAGGKMSSSSGNVVTLGDILKVYEPEMVRYIFANNRTNIDFAISFDSEVIKNYDEYDRMERLALGIDQGNDKKTSYAKRVYEISQVNDVNEACAFQPAFRHLCNLLQINDHNIDNAIKAYQDDIKTDADKTKFYSRSERANYWLKNFAPEEFIFAINKEKRSGFTIDEKGIQFLTAFKVMLETDWDSITTDKELHEKMYLVIHEVEIDPKDAFALCYQLLITREKGPKLAGFIRAIGKDRVISLL
ncbi:MAG: lysyl-tRNA synthetase class 1 [Thermoproteota archaeon]